MRRGSLLACGLLVLVVAASSLAEPTGFEGTIAPLSAGQRARMTGVSWQPGCPVPLRDLRLVTVTHWGFDSRVRTGRLVVHRSAASEVIGVFRRLYAARFPIRRIVPVDAYGGSDFRSIERDNTSAFNCRRATGSSNWSEHAYGRAIDVNPIENPYVEGGRVYHEASLPYVARVPIRPGMAVRGRALVDAFAAIDWGWGGDWSGSVRDYQHFSASGR